ncbi:MAG: ATP-binding protein, partial [Abitibacteriaceae bacterium]|nr:ATP-binding protein [Abditibacteriaceae bacterium]
MTLQPLQLCPAQQRALEGLKRGLGIGHVLALWSETGLGKTTVLREIQRVTGGGFLNMADFMDAMRGQHPIALEETFERLVLDALAIHDVVIVDDLHLLTNVSSCGDFYLRSRLLDAPLTTLCTYAEETGKRLIFGTDDIPGVVRKRCYPWGVREFEVSDYQFICGAWLGAQLSARLNFEKIYRFAPKLNGHQLKSACCWLRQERDLTTERFIDYLRAQHMTSNVDLGEVQAVDLPDLKGIDDIIQSLEANIILPLENDELAKELNIKPKRGVLLAGPPGTGKTTVGRALAHRLRSKFFLIDGTFISGTSQFYARIHYVFEAAKQNAPAIIFIDDSDVIFEDNEDMGL